MPDCDSCGKQTTGFLCRACAAKAKRSGVYIPPEIIGRGPTRRKATRRKATGGRRRKKEGVFKRIFRFMQI